MEPSEAWSIDVGGDPATQGSKRLVRLRTGRSVMIEQSARVKPWRSTVADAARAAGVTVLDGDVAIHVVARWLRPASHFRKDGRIRPSAPSRPGRGDCDKLARAICDALAGIAYRNDRQVALLAVERVWASPGEGPGATIGIAPAPAAGVWTYSEEPTGP